MGGIRGKLLDIGDIKLLKGRNLPDDSQKVVLVFRMIVGNSTFLIVPAGYGVFQDAAFFWQSADGAVTAYRQLFKSGILRQVKGDGRASGKAVSTFKILRSGREEKSSFISWAGLSSTMI